MLQIKNLATANDYTDALTLVDPRADHLDLVIAGAAVFAEFKPHLDDEQEADFMPERLLLPMQGPFEECSGVRLRSALAGAPAQVVAQLLLPGEPRSGGVPFTGFLAPSNAIGTTLALQTGDIFESTIAPPYAGAILCDGTHYNAVTDPTLENLWNEIGITFGGAGKADFAVPDKRDRVSVGAGGNTPLGGNEGVPAANRHATRHRHAPHHHSTTTTVANLPSPNFNPANIATPGAGVTGDSDGGSGVATDPLDGPGFLGLYTYIVK